MLWLLKIKIKIKGLLAINAYGIEKLKSFVMGRTRKLRCFKNVKKFLSKYAANLKLWLILSLFTDFLTSIDKSIKLQKKKKSVV